MAGSIKAKVVRIGNSRGLRIPKSMLDALDLDVEQEVSLKVKDGQIIVRPTHHSRHGWAEQFKLMAERGDDALLDPDHATSSWDDTEWSW